MRTQTASWRSGSFYFYIPARAPDIPGLRRLSAAPMGASQPPGVHDAPQEPPGSLVLGVGEQLGRRGVLDDPPFFQEAHPAGDIPGKTHLVRGDEHGHTG